MGLLVLLETRDLMTQYKFCGCWLSVVQRGDGKSIRGRKWLFFTMKGVIIHRLQIQLSIPRKAPQNYLEGRREGGKCSLRFFQLRTRRNYYSQVLSVPGV